MNTIRLLVATLIAAAITVTTPTAPANACRPIASPDGYAACGHINQIRRGDAWEIRRHKKIRKPGAGVHWTPTR